MLQYASLSSDSDCTKMNISSHAGISNYGSFDWVGYMTALADRETNPPRSFLPNSREWSSDRSCGFTFGFISGKPPRITTSG